MGASCCNSNLSKEHEELIAAVGSTKKVMDDPQQFEDQEVSEVKEIIVHFYLTRRKTPYSYKAMNLRIINPPQNMLDLLLMKKN